jgi:serine/threonine protein kinase
MINPAEQLKGLPLDGGWKVVDKVQRSLTGTGGNFSIGYLVEHTDGRHGFLKAMNYQKAFSAVDTPAALVAMSEAYLFEKELCEKTGHLSRIVRAIGGGSVVVDNKVPSSKVDYLIFERADCDIRAHLDVVTALDVVFLLRTLHNVATGLSQLHRTNIAHQDLKPSNVLVYGAVRGSKIADLGRAWDQSMPARHYVFDVAGDPNYAPVEIWYGYLPPDDRTRRFGCDLYHLGGLLTFLFARIHFNSILLDSLSIPHRPMFWGGTYSEALPFVQSAFAEAVERIAAEFPKYLKEELQCCLMELCNPEPSRRGHPSNFGKTQFSLERYISKFDLLTHKAKLELVKLGKPK